LALGPEYSLGEPSADFTRAFSDTRRISTLSSKLRVKLDTHWRGGLQPGVNLDNTTPLLDLLDTPNAAS
jgi:hypothetical protein